MGDRLDFEYTEPRSTGKEGDSRTDPVDYFLRTPTTKEIPHGDQFKNWPLEIDPFSVDFATEPKFLFPF